MRGRKPVIFGLGIASAMAISLAPAALSSRAGAAQASEARQAAEANVISGLSAQAQGAKTVVVLKGSAIPSFTAYRLMQPPRLVIDVSNGKLAAAAAESRQVQADTWAVGQVSIDERVGDATQVTRLLIGLKRDSSYTVRAEGHDLVVTISPDELPARVAAAVTMAAVTPLPTAAAPVAAPSPSAASRAAGDEKAGQAAAELARLIQARARDLEAAQKQAAAYRTQIASAQGALQQAEDERRGEEARLAHDRTQAEQALHKALAQKSQTEEDVRRLEAARSELSQQERELSARLGQEQQRGSSQIEALRRQTALTERQALLTQEQVDGAQAALRRAEKTREQVEQARRSEETRLAALLSQREQAEQKMAEQAALLRAQREEIARLQSGQKAATAAAVRPAPPAHPSNPNKVTATPEPDELATSLPPAPAARPALPDPEVSAQLVRMQHELLDAQRQAQALQDKVAKAHRDLQDTESRRAQAEKQRQQEEVRLAAVSQRKAETERERQAEEARLASLAQQKTEAQRQRQAAEVSLATLSQQKTETRRERQAEEARLVSLTRQQAVAEKVRQAEEAHLASLTQQQAAAEKARRAEEARLASLTRRQTEAQKQRQAEEARLAALAAQKAETERARQAEEARLAALAAQKAETEKARQAEEARLLALNALTRARQQAEAERSRNLLAEQSSKDALVSRQPTRQPARVEVPVQQKAPAVADNEGVETQPVAWPIRRPVTLHAYAPPRQQDAAPEALAYREPARPAPGTTARSQSVAAPQTVAAPRATGTGGLVQIRDVRFEDDGQTERIIVELAGTSVETTVYADSRTAVLRLQGAQLARDLTRTLDATAYNGPVQTVSSFTDPRNPHAVRLVVAMNRQVEPTLLRRGARLLWEFPRALAQRAPRILHRGPSHFAILSFAAPRFAAFGNPPIPLQVVPAQAGPGPGNGGGGPPAEPLSVGRRTRRYNGRRIDLDFKDADIHNILRLLSDVGQVNIVTADDVKGTVTIRMRDVPWDQALDVILKAKSLGYIREGNLIRVAPQEKLDKESEAETARLKNRVELQPIETRLIPLSYADAGKMKTRVQDVISPRGKVSFDDRTNILIISDMAPNIALAEDLLRNLDTQIPQVLIEARIVEARTTYSRAIGIQWGGNYQASTATGNPTGLSFPANVGVGGGATDATAPTTGLGFGAANPGYIVNMPAGAGTGTGGALGIALGSIAGTANVNLRLSAMEASGNVRIVSAPKVTTSDNYQAVINQGVSIPVSVVSAAGANTQFFDAKLELSVKPHVTNEGAVLMDIKVTKNTPDTAITGSNGTPSIDKEEAKTQVLVRDGDTAVIGGIYQRTTGQSYAKVPFLGDIPILGWLFKTRSDSDTRSEMLIFITPHIVNRSSSITPPSATSAAP